jgi:PIN domain nuclease of toxin-antitoxin system
VGGLQVILLDTHAWIWWLSTPDLLSTTVAEEIQRAKREDGVLISCISAWEVAMLTARGRLVLDRDVRNWIAASEALPFVRFVPVDNDIAIASVELSDFDHRDPADRLIVATAVARNVPLATKDAKLRGYSRVSSIW